jgi:ubiquinone biosynthesis monooxygenase Coq7
MTKRHFSLLDSFIIESDRALRTVFGRPEVSERATPGDELIEGELTSEEQKNKSFFNASQSFR